MKKSNVILISCAIALLVFLSACGHNPTRFKQVGPYVDISGVKYRTEGAFNVDLLRVGIKRRDVLSSFEPKFRPVIVKEVEVKQAVEIANEETQSSATDAAAKAGFEIAKVDAGGTLSREGSSTATFRVLKVFDVLDLMIELNSDENREKLNFFIDHGRDLRIVTSVAVAFGYTAHEKTSKASNVSLAVKYPKAGNPEVSLKHSDGTEGKTTLSDGAIFAYEISRFCWKKGPDGQPMVADLQVDRPGIEKTCPNNTKTDPTKF